MRRGVVGASDELDGPGIPEDLLYLRGWFFELRQGVGDGVNGLAPLTWPVLRAWRCETGRTLERHEVDALFALDHALRFPEEPVVAVEIDEPRSDARFAWPAKKSPSVEQSPERFV